MKPSELRRRIAAYQNTKALDTPGEALDALAKDVPCHRATLYRHLATEYDFPPLVAARIRTLTDEPKP